MAREDMLPALLARLAIELEAKTHGSRKLDCRIAKLFGAVWFIPAMDAIDSEDGEYWMRENGPDEVTRIVPRYTSSRGAMLPGEAGSVLTLSGPLGGRWCAVLAVPPLGPYIAGFGSTEPLARRAAALRLLAHHVNEQKEAAHA